MNLLTERPIQDNSKMQENLNFNAMPMPMQDNDRLMTEMAVQQSISARQNTYQIPTQSVPQLVSEPTKQSPSKYQKKNHQPTTNDNETNSNSKDPQQLVELQDQLGVIFGEFKVI